MYNEENNNEYGWQQEDNVNQEQQAAAYAEAEEIKTCQTGGDGSQGGTKKESSGFGKKMTRCVAYALAFGLVAGTAFEGGSYAIGHMLGNGKAVVEADTESRGNTLQATSVSTGAAKNISSADVSKIVEEAMPSIVAITNMAQVQYPSFFGQMQNRESESAGSGIVVGEDDTYLYIATNNHVVQGADSLTVQFDDSSTVSAEVQGTDSTNDLAVVKVKKEDMEESTREHVKVAVMGDSTDLPVGVAAIAIGNALGYGQSVTTGVISALDRQVTIQDETTGLTVSSKLIQTDAAINPGNSGGALLNAEGEVIGINSSKYSDTDVEGMGFAIPISTAKPIIEELISTGKSTSAQGAYIGLTGADITKDVASAYKLPVGAYITQVIEGSAAAEAGLSQGDIITKIDDTNISSFTEVRNIISGHRAGDTVKITYQRRDGSGEYKENVMDVTLGERPAEDNANQKEAPNVEEDNNDDYGNGGYEYDEDDILNDLFRYFGR